MNISSLKNKLFFLLVDNEPLEKEVMKCFEGVAIIPQVVHSAEEAIQMGTKMKIDFFFCDEEIDECEEIFSKLKTNNPNCRRVFIRVGENPDKEPDIILLPFNEDDLVNVLFAPGVRRLEDEKTISGKTIYMKSTESLDRGEIIRLEDKSIMFSIHFLQIDPEELKNGEVFYGEEDSDHFSKLEGEFVSVDFDEENDVIYIEYNCKDQSVVAKIQEQREKTQKRINEFIKKK